MIRNLLALTVFTFAPVATLGSTPAAQPASQKHQSRAESEKVDFHITGEVSNGKAFQQDIGHDLLFRLVPPSNGENAGWLIEIVPKSYPDDDPIEFSTIATPPYNAYNERCIATVYGRAANEAVNLKDRTFFFVELTDDEHRAEEVVNAALYPTNVSDEERVRVAAEQPQIHLGKGELHILKSRINRGRSINDAGTIDWMRFDVNIEFSTGLTMANIIARVAHPH